MLIHSGPLEDPPPTTLTRAEAEEVWREARRRGHELCCVAENDGTTKWALLSKRKLKPTIFSSLEEIRAALGVPQ